MRGFHGVPQFFCTVSASKLGVIRAPLFTVLTLDKYFISNISLRAQHPMKDFHPSAYLDVGSITCLTKQSPLIFWLNLTLWKTQQVSSILRSIKMPFSINLFFPLNQPQDILGKHYWQTSKISNIVILLSLVDFKWCWTGTNTGIQIYCCSIRYTHNFNWCNASHKLLEQCSFTIRKFSNTFSDELLLIYWKTILISAFY